MEDRGGASCCGYQNWHLRVFFGRNELYLAIRQQQVDIKSMIRLFRGEDGTVNAFGCFHQIDGKLGI